MRWTLTIVLLLAAPCGMFAVATDAATPLVRKEGKFVALELKEENWKILKDPEAYLEFLDEVYEAFEELVGGVPHGGEKQRILEVDYYPGGWAVAGQPIRWYSRYVPESLRKVNEGDALFGILHEIGHSFDIGAWNWHPEFFANFKMMYVVEKLGSHGLNIQESEKYFRDIAVRRGAEDGKPLSDWYAHSDAATHKFLLLKNEIGWEPFKKTFREFVALPADKVSGIASRDVRVVLFIHLLGKHSGKDLWEQTERWGFPVIHPAEYKIDMSGAAFLDAVRDASSVFAKVTLSPLKAAGADGNGTDLEVVCRPTLKYNPTPLEEGEPRGIWTHAPSTITFDLGGRYTRFEAAGRQGDNGSIVFKVQLDGKTVWESPAMRENKMPDQPARLDVTGANTITLIVTDAGDGVGYDSAVWVEARLTDKRGGSAYLDEMKPTHRKGLAPYGFRRGLKFEGPRFYKYFPAFPKGKLDIRATVGGKSFEIVATDAPGVYRGRARGLSPGRHPLLLEMRYGGVVQRKPNAASVEVLREEHQGPQEVGSSR